MNSRPLGLFPTVSPKAEDRFIFRKCKKRVLKWISLETVGLKNVVHTNLWMIDLRQVLTSLILTLRLSKY